MEAPLFYTNSQPAIVVSVVLSNEAWLKLSCHLSLISAVPGDG